MINNKCWVENQGRTRVLFCTYKSSNLLNTIQHNNLGNERLYRLCHFRRGALHSGEVHEPHDNSPGCIARLFGSRPRTRRADSSPPLPDRNAATR